MDYNKSLLYFDGRHDGISKPALILAIVMTILAVAFGIFDGKANELFFGVLLMLFAGCFVVSCVIIYTSTSKVFLTGPAYDENVRAFYENTWKDLAFKRLGIDESEVSEVAPIVLGGYEFEGFDRIRQGNDGIWRSNIFKLVAIFFSANELHCYTLRFNTLRSEMTEGTDVYFYEDIVSVSTSSLNHKVKVGEQEVTVNSETFKLTTRAGTSFTVNVANAQQAQESVNAMRSLLREKKQA